MRINPETFKKLRDSMGFSQQTLANESGVAKKTIARIESGKGEPRGSTVRLLAKALRIKDIQILAQEPDSEAVHEEELRKSGTRQVTVRLDAETIFAHDLVRDRYGLVLDGYDVVFRLILDGAPIFFALLAEMSLADRRRRVEEMKAIIPDHLYPEELEKLVVREEDSIAKKDVFAHLITGGGEEKTPFGDFLSQLAEKVDPESDMLAHESWCWGLFDDEFTDPPCVCETYRKKLTGGSARADYALSRGYTRIGQIPKELRGEDEDITAERVEWLESKVPDEDWEEHEERMRPLREATAKIINKSLSEGGKADA